MVLSSKLLLGRILAEGGAVPDLDVVQAVDDDARRRQHGKNTAATKLKCRSFALRRSCGSVRRSR